MEDRVGEVQQDQVSLGVLVTAVPRDAVDAAVAACGVVARRGGGKLPAHVTAYLTMALCLFWQDDYEEVATKVTGSLDRWGCWDASWSVPTASGITQARKRLGRDVLAAVFDGVVGPVATMCRTPRRMRASSGTPGLGKTVRPTPRCGWWRCPSAAPTRSWPPRSPRTRSGRRPWPTGCTRA